MSDGSQLFLLIKFCDSAFFPADLAKNVASFFSFDINSIGRIIRDEHCENVFADVLLFAFNSRKTKMFGLIRVVGAVAFDLHEQRIT